MNKQEALAAVLTEARRYEEPHREVRSWEGGQIEDTLLEQARDLDHLITRLRSGDVTARTEAQYRQRLVRLAGAALQLLITEVTVVEGKALEDWLKEKEHRPQLHITTSPASYQPVALNGALAREAYDRGLRDGRAGR